MERKGSLTGKCSEPQRTECSRIWATPVLSAGGGAEVEGEHILLIIVMDMVDLTTRPYMFKQIAPAPVLFQFIRCNQAERVGKGNFIGHLLLLEAVPGIKPAAERIH